VSCSGVSCHLSLTVSLTRCSISTNSAALLKSRLHVDKNVQQSLLSDYRKLVMNKPCHIILLPYGCLHLEVGGKEANANGLLAGCSQQLMRSHCLYVDTSGYRLTVDMCQADSLDWYCVIDHPQNINTEIETV
jgi:hypothetical protein